MANHSFSGDDFAAAGETHLSHAHPDWNLTNLSPLTYHLSTAANAHFQPAYSQGFPESIPPTKYRGMGSPADNGVPAQFVVYIFRSTSGPR